ncbi:MAG: SDR family oxidoreductase [bacterium]|nr:SDR family oxidoreductase [bacterium]
MTRLEGKVAVITGGAGDIGLATAQLFTREGAKVLLVDINEKALRKAIRLLDQRLVDYTIADVTNPLQTQEYVQTAVKHFGGIDIFVNNAGIHGTVNRIINYPIEIFDKVIAVNTRGVWLGLKYVIPKMKERGGGSIIITSSFAGIRGAKGMSAYVASKHAAVGIMRAAALECAEIGIRVNSVNPAIVEGQMMRSLEEEIIPVAPEKAKDHMAKGSPMKRYGTPEEVAEMILFLASDESKYCTGGVYMVDGGLSAG